MSSKSKIEGVTKGVTGGHGGHDPLCRSSVKGVTGGHRTRKVTPVTPQSGGHDARTAEKFQESFSAPEKYELEEFSGTPVPLEELRAPRQVTEHNGQRYVLFSSDPHTTQDGRKIELYKFLSACRGCGATFSITVAASTQYWNARCPGCIRRKRAA